jgi:hypothetical protein
MVHLGLLNCKFKILPVPGWYSFRRFCGIEADHRGVLEAHDPVAWYGEEKLSDGN